MRTSDRILYNAVTNWASVAVNAVVAILLVPFLISKLGKEGYGLVSLLTVIVSLMMAADLGIRGALSRQLAEQLAREDSAEYNVLFSSTICYYAFIGSLFALLCFFAAPSIPRLFNISPVYTVQAVRLVRYYSSIAVFLTCINAVFIAVIVSHNRFDLANIVALATNIARAAGFFLVFEHTAAGLYGWAAVMLVTQTCGLFVAIAVSYRTSPLLCFGFGRIRISTFRILLSLGGYLAILELTGILSVRADPLIISTVLSPKALALYYPALTLAGAIRPLVNTLSQQLSPLATGLHVKGSVSGLKSVLVRGTRLTFLMGAPAAVCLAVFAEPVCRIWLKSALGMDYMITAHALILWAIVDFCAYAAGSQFPVLLGMNRLAFMVWTHVPAAVVNIVASYAIVRYTHLGVIGVVIPTALIGLLRRPVLTYYTARVCGVKLSAYFTESYLRPMIVALMVGMLAAILLFSRQPNTVLDLVIYASLIFAAWLACSWTLGCNHEDRANLRSILNKLAFRVVHSVEGAA